MATPTKLDIQAVKDAMAKTPWLNYVDAARQVRWVQNPVAPITAPVAPLVPTPTVAPITNQEVQQGVNAVWGTAEQRRQTRTDITANQTIAPPVAPVSPSVTESPAPVTEKTGITQDAFQQAQAKSAEIKAQNDAVMAQNKQKSDLAREDAALAAQAAIPTDKKGIVNAMVTGASIPVQKTEAYNKAVVTSDLFKKFSWMTSDQLFQNLQQGQIGTELSGLLASNPNFAIAKQKYEQVQKTNAINTQTNAMYNAANWKENTVVDELGKIESKYPAPAWTNEQAYEQFVTKDPDVVKSWLELKNLATQINTVTKTYNDALKSLKEQYPDMPASALITLMGTRTKDTKELLDSYISAKELAKGDFDLAMKMADGHYNAVSKDIAVQQQEAQQIAQEQRQMQNTLALWQAQFDQKITQQIQIAKNPDLAIPDLIQQYANQGIFASTSPEQHIAEFKKQKLKGTTLGQYLSKMTQDFQAKPEYKAKFAPKATEYWFSNIGDGRIAITNPKTGQVSFANAGSVSSTNAPTTTSAKMLDIPTGTDVWVQCGTFARQLCGLDATPGWNSLEARQKAFTGTAPQAGGMVLFTGGNYDKTYGHIASIESVNPDGTMNVVESNLNGDNKVTRRTLQANDPAISGFYNNTPLAKQGAQGTFTATEEAWANNIMNGKAKISDITNKDGVDKGKVLQLMNQKTGGTTGTMQTNIQSGLEIVNKLINHPGRTSVTGAPSIFTNPFWYSLTASDARDFKWELKRMEAIWFLNMIPQMQWMGALSNSEGSRLAAAYSKLADTWIPEANYLEELNRLKEWMEKALKNMWATIPEEPKQTTGWWQTVGGELDYSKYE